MGFSFLPWVEYGRESIVAPETPAVLLAAVAAIEVFIPSSAIAMFRWLIVCGIVVLAIWFIIASVNARRRTESETKAHHRATQGMINDQGARIEGLLQGRSPSEIVRRALANIKQTYALLDPFFDRDREFWHEARVYEWYKDLPPDQRPMVIRREIELVNADRAANERRFMQDYLASKLHDRLIEIAQEFASHGAHSEMMDALIEHRLTPMEPYTVQNQVDDLSRIVQDYVTNHE